MKRFLSIITMFALLCSVLSFASLAEEAQSADDWWNILLLGTDNRYEEGLHGRTDSMMILSVNRNSGEAKLASVMRDTWVEIPGHGHNKLNTASRFGGPELTVEVFNNCFDLNIKDYVLINISGLAEIIDSIGGIDVDVTEEERKALNKGLFNLSSASGMEKLEESGENVHLNGNQAVAFSRIRKIDSDRFRTERQRKVLVKIAEKLKDNANVGTIAFVVSKFLPYVETNLTLDKMLNLASIGLNIDLANVETLTLPAEGTYKSGTVNGTWRIDCNFDKNASLLHDYIYG